MVKEIEAKSSYTQGSNFHMDLMKEKFQSLLTLFLIIKM